MTVTPLPSTARARRTVAALAVAGVATLTPVAVSSAATGTTPTRESVAAIGGSNRQPMPTGQLAYQYGATLAALSGKSLETTFMGGIIPHHQGAITMAKLELARGVDPDIRTHAENIIASQQHQITQFTSWLRSWYHLTPAQAQAQAPEPARAQIGSMKADIAHMISMLRAVPAGHGFDVAFVKMMIPHHTSGIVEFLEPQERAVHAQLRVAAATGITGQEAEAADFRTWLAQQ